MSFKSAGCLDCSLTRYLKELSELTSDDERTVFAAVTLSYLGYFQHEQQKLDDQRLRQLTEMLEEQGQAGFPSECKSHCLRCAYKPDCPVGKIVLKD